MHAFEILGHPVRRRIVELLADGEQAAGELGSGVQPEFAITQPADAWLALCRRTPDRLPRWYVPVTGDLRVGGSFEQAMMGAGTIVRCEPPAYLLVSLGGGRDELRLHALGLYLAGALPADYDTLTFFRRADMRPEIERGSAAMQALLDTDV